MADDFALFPASNKGIIASIDDQGVVTFVVLAGPDSPIRGTELFNRMMDHFGSTATAIHCVWRKSSVGDPSTNIDKVNELTALQMPIEDAVLRTWTVTRAAKRGFTRVQLLGPPIGQPGNYTSIDVLIER